MNRRDFIGLLLGASVIPTVLPLSTACSAFGAGCEGREEIKRAAALDTTLTTGGAITNEEFKMVWGKPDFALAC